MKNKIRRFITVFVYAGGTAFSVGSKAFSFAVMLFMLFIGFCVEEIIEVTHR